MSINIGDGVIRILGDTTGADRSLEGLGQKAKRAGQKGVAGLKPMSASLSNIKKLALSVGGVFLAWRVFQVLRDATKAALAFGKEFANVATLINTQTPKGVKQLQILKQQILALRPELGSARELTQGLYQALSAGAEPAEAVKLVGEAALFAKAGLTSTLVAVDVITTAINAYGLSAEDAASVSSVLFKTIEEGKITGEELASSLGRVISTAAQLNIDLPELNAGIATMTKAGVPAAEAMTTMVAILRTFTSVEATKRFDELGISQAKIRDIIAKDGLNAALQELDKRLKGNTAATTALFRESEAQKGIFILLGKGAEEYKRILGVLKKAQEEATATAIAAEKQFATLDARLETLSVTIQTEFIAAMDRATPALNAMLDSAEDLTAGLDPLQFLFTTLFNILVILIGGWVLFKRSVENAGFQVFRLLAGISGLVEKIPLLNKFLGANAALTSRFTDIQKNFADSWERSNQQISKVEKALIGARAEIGKIAKETPAASDGIDKVGAAAGRVGPSFDLAAAGMARFRGENAALMEEYHRLQVQQTLDDLNNSLEILGINLEELPQTAEEALGQFGEIAEAAVPRAATAFENLRDIGSQALEDLTGAFQQAVQAWILGGGSIGEAMKRAAAGVLAGVAAQAAILAIFELAKGFAALFFNPAEAASHFKAAALFSATAVAAGAAAKAIAPAGRTATVTGGRGEARGVITVGGEEEEAGPLIVERRLAMGGLITRPTLAMLGERGPEIVVPVGRSAGLARAAGEELATVIEQHFNITIEGLVSPDNLDDVIEQITDRVRNSNVGLQASDSFRTTEK
jgi:TP901 family phage tail tape measure protein